MNDLFEFSYANGVLRIGWLAMLATVVLLWLFVMVCGLLLRWTFGAP